MCNSTAFPVSAAAATLSRAPADIGIASPVTPLGAGTAARDPSRPHRAGRARLWETDPTHLCQLVGTCIDARTARDVARRAGYDDAGMPDYEIHHACVHAARDRHHPLARALQKRLESVHAAEVRRFSRLRDREALRAAWENARDSGDIAGALWALHTHPHADETLLQHVFGEVHMLQHECGFREASQRRRLTKAQARLVELEKAADGERARHARRAASDADTIATLRAEVAALRADRASRPRPAAHADAGLTEAGRADDGASPPASPVTRNGNKAALMETLRARESEQRARAEAAAAERDAARDDAARLEAILASVLDKAADDTPRPVSLCGRCVLVIGGQAHQCRHYRALVEANEGVFLHHDGGVEDKLARVAELVGRADAVLCPTSQVSHGAMHRARRLCRSSDKPMIFMQRSSLAAFASGLEQVAAAG